MGFTLLPLIVVLLCQTREDTLAPWASNRHPSDVSKTHVQEIKGPRVDYRVVQHGTMDGRNCRSPQGVWQPFEQTWESNRSVRMENTGRTNVVNPWLTRAGGDFRTIARIVSRAIQPGMTDSDKARALWWQEIQYRFHWEGDNDELLDPVKVFNVYGHNTCGNDSIALAGLWRNAGFKVAPAHLVGHCVTQVMYNGSWHLFDGDMHSIYLLRDNETIASEQDLVRDHDLVRRTHTQGILQPDRRSGDEWESSIYVFEGPVSGDRNSAISSMNMTLRPHEAIVWRWGHTSPIKYHGSNSPRFPDRICNGLWEYRPDFNDPSWRGGAESVQSIGEQDGALVPEEGKTGTIVWTITCPYVIVGGRLDAEAAGATFKLSWDGRSWQTVDRDLDALFPPGGPRSVPLFSQVRASPEPHDWGGCRSPTTSRWPRSLCRKWRSARTRSPTPTSRRATGASRSRTTGSSDPRAGRRRRLPNRVFQLPAEPHRARQLRSNGSPRPIRTATRSPTITSSFLRADMRWPLSMSFAKLISRTALSGHPRYTLPGPGLLNPGTTYYWHVRAKDGQGVWGPWSPTWTFTAGGPAPPHGVRLEVEPYGTRGVLRWTANPMGRKPAAYRIYASDEKGFSANDTSYQVTVGVSQDLPSEFPTNFVAETPNTELEVLGPGVKPTEGNKAFYRVVAVDDAGNRSGPSDYAASPRPLVVSAPVTLATKGTSYRYSLLAIRSLGDLRTRVVNGKETMSFWDVERLRFAIERGPRWLSIDPATGLLSGTPDRSGPTEVVVSATLEHEARKLDEDALKWGVEKVVSASKESLGTTTQRFTIAVRP